MNKNGEGNHPLSQVKPISYQKCRGLIDNAKLVDIPMRIAIPLDNAGIRRITDLVSIGRNELLKINRLGEKSVNEIEKILANTLRTAFVAISGVTLM